jgi:uncharacterized protein (TIGR02453 family)
VSASAHFDPQLFKFLRELKANNSRPWFLANKERYERHARQPMLRFIADVGPGLRKISPNFLADPRPVGGSMFRIHRDTRFSKDKSPYKIMVAAQFRHVKGKDVHAPGFYLHLEPARVFAGAGLWRPDATGAAKVRQAMAKNPAAWKRAIGARAFRADCTLEGESLRRPPRGHDPQHPLIEDLKRKDFIAMREFTQAEVCSDGFLELYVRTCRSMAPLMKFLTGALGLAW